MGFFDRFRRPRPDPVPGAHAAVGPRLAMVLLSADGDFDGARAIAHLGSQWSGAPAIEIVESNGAALRATIPGGTLGLMLVPMPVPAAELEGPAAVAWHWPDAAADVARHQRHVVVMAASTELHPIDLCLLHSRLVAAVAATAGAIGVYVGSAMLVRAATDYISEAEAGSRDAVPTMLWVGFNPVNDDGLPSAYSTGLGSFGLPELEVRRSRRPAAELLGTMADAATYQLQTGAVLGDGQTFGASAAERIRVRHTSSAFLPDTTVALLGL